MSSAHLATLDDVRLVELPRHCSVNGDLVVAQEGAEVPFVTHRTFTVRAEAGAVRGQHAHRHCKQFMLCVQGAIDVECDDGERRATFTLAEGHHGLYVPASVWATETYRVSDSVLIVFCDRHYEVDDYIRSYDDFMAFRRGARP